MAYQYTFVGRRAASAYASGYLKPRADFLASRLHKFHSHLLPGVHNYTGDVDGTAPPPPSAREIHLHHTMQLDGRTIAKSTVKHMVRHGNMVSGAGRLSDAAFTRPMAI